MNQPAVEMWGPGQLQNGRSTYHLALLLLLHSFV